MLEEEFSRLSDPGDEADAPDFVVAELASGILIGRGPSERISLLFSVGEASSGRASIVLPSMSAHQRLKVRLLNNGVESEITALVLVLLEPSLRTPFLSFARVLLRAFDREGSEAVWALVVGMSRVFQARSLPATQELTGLLGEIIFVYAWGDRNAAIEAWASEPSSKFDFVLDGTRMDVKTTRGRNRRHHLRLEQTRPVDGEYPFFVSICVDVGVGTSLRHIVDEIHEDERLTSANRLKLEEKVAQSAGADALVYESTKVDLSAALINARVYRGQDIPRVTSVMAGVSEVRFSSDFDSIESSISLMECAASGSFDA